jgi:hypothetical protein
MRKKYTYIPNSEIESLTTWNGVEISGNKLLDGAYAKGNVKYAHGGMPEMHDDKQAFGSLTFEDLEKIFDVDLFQFDENEVEAELDDLKKRWDALKKQDRIKLLNYYKPNWKNEYCSGGYMALGGMESKTIEQKAQELIGDTWYSMNDEQRAISVTEFITDGTISTNTFNEGGNIRDAFLYLFEEKKTNVDFYEDANYLSVFSNDLGELEAVATYIDIPTSRIKYDKESNTYFIQIDKEGAVMAGGGGVKEAGYVVIFTVGGKKIKKNFSTQEDMDAGIADFYMENLDVENVEIQEKKKEAAIDVFASAKEEKKKSKKDEKDRVEIEGIEDKISRVYEIMKMKKTLEAEEKLIKGEIKELAREKFIEKYEQMGRRPDNFKVAEGDEEILFIVQDNYITVSDEKMVLLKENYPELLSEKVTYKISEMMMKKEGKDGRQIGEILKDLIGRSRDITDEDKANLFTITRDMSITDGAIEKLAEYDNIEEVYNIIQPIEALK